MQKGQMSWSKSATSCLVTPMHPKKPTITLVALDHQPAVIRTTAETIHICIGGEVRGLSASTSGPWDLTRTAPRALGPGSIYRGSQGLGGHRVF